MAPKSFGRLWYARLLRCYPETYRERYGEGMEQTFADLCRDRHASGHGVWRLVIWTFAETLIAIITQHISDLRRGTVSQDSTRVLRTVRTSALIVGALMVTGIVTLMFLARGTDEDITGIVAPALLITVVSCAVAIVASVRARRARPGGMAR